LRILMIGGTGLTGPHIARRLHAQGHTLLLFHRGQTQADLPAEIAHLSGDRRELAPHAAALAGFAPEVVVDMALVTAQDAWDVMCLFRGVARRVVAISSQDVYRAYGRLIGTEPGPPDGVPLDEDAPLREKLHPYRARASGPDNIMFHYDKILVERLILGDPRLPGTVLRYPLVYGPRDRQHRLFPYLKRMDDARPAILLGEGQARWRWTKGYAEDMAAAAVLAILADRAAGRVYNVGEERALSEAEWVAAIAGATGWRGRIAALPQERLPRHLAEEMDCSQDLVTDTRRIREELGYREETDPAEALRRTIDWERAHPPDPIDAASFEYAAEDRALADCGLGRERLGAQS